MNPSTKTNPYKIPISSAVTEGDMEPCQGQPQHNLPITAKKKKRTVWKVLRFLALGMATCACLPNLCGNAFSIP